MYLLLHIRVVNALVTIKKNLSVALCTLGPSRKDDFCKNGNFQLSKGSVINIRQSCHKFLELHYVLNINY